MEILYSYLILFVFNKIIEKNSHTKETKDEKNLTNFSLALVNLSFSNNDLKNIFLKTLDKIKNNKNFPLIYKIFKDFIKRKKDSLIELEKSQPKDILNFFEFFKLKNQQNLLFDLQEPVIITVTSITLLDQGVNQGLGRKKLIKNALKSGTKFLSEQVLQNICYNPHIYSDKIEQNREEKTVIFECTHFYINIKKGELLVLTTDFAQFGLSKRMVGRVNRIIRRQKVELLFILGSNLSENWTNAELEKVQSCFVKERIKNNKQFKIL